MTETYQEEPAGEGCRGWVATRPEIIRRGKATTVVDMVCGRGVVPVAHLRAMITAVSDAPWWLADLPWDGDIGHLIVRLRGAADELLRSSESSGRGESVPELMTGYRYDSDVRDIGRALAAAVDSTRVDP